MTSEPLRKMLVAGAALAVLSVAAENDRRRRERERNTITFTAKEGDNIIITGSRSRGVTTA